jgi:hypothetical protein
VGRTLAPAAGTTAVQPEVTTAPRPILARGLTTPLTFTRTGEVGPQSSCGSEVWPIPEGGSEISLEMDEVLAAGDRIEGKAVVNLGMLQDELYEGIGPFVVVLVMESPVATFTDGRSVLEHTVRTDLIAADGTYVFDFALLGVTPGLIQIRASWRWKILSEGSCALAINGVYAGCALGGQLNSACVCKTLNALVPPGSWGCKLHPLTFRAVWKLWNCAATFGPSPY